MLNFLIALLVVTQPPPAAPPRQPAAVGLASADIRVTDRTGVAIEGTTVAAEGTSSREAVTTADGRVLFRTMAPGAYRIRASRKGFVTLEKEVTLRGANTAKVELALSAEPPAPSPPPPSPPPPPPAAAAAAPPPALPVKPGEPRVVDVATLAEKSLGGRDAVKLVPIGCSGLGSAQLMLVRDSVKDAAHADADEFLYVMAGEVSLTMSGKQQSLTPGWLVVVPRGTAYSATKKGRNPAILVVVASGPPCS